MSPLNLGSREREERGTVEGTLLKVGTTYNAPAVKIRERKSGVEVWCRITAEEQEKISRQSNFKDVWERRRVLVRGKIRYRDDGKIVSVIATSIEPFRPREMTLSEIHDPEFTGGLPASEYLDKLREGDLG